MIKSKKLSKFKNIKHGFFNKNGGVSRGIYQSLNCGMGSLDLTTNIKKNINIVCKKIKTKYNNLILLNQYHSNKFHFISKRQRLKKILKGDALITDKKNIILGVLTADCAPILIYDQKKEIVSAIHAGWKGAYKGIIKKVVDFLIKKGSLPNDLIAVVGPCISIDNYEVQKKFREKFINRSKKNKIFFVNKKNKTYFSLKDYILYQLKYLGINNIEIIKKDTFDKNNHFFSARRSQSKRENDYGRNISIIMIN